MIQAAAPPNTAAQVRDSGWLGRLLYSLGNTVSHWFQAATLTSPDDRVNLDRSVATRKEVQDAFVDGASLIVSGIGGVKTATTVAVETAEVAAEVVVAKGGFDAVGAFKNAISPFKGGSLTNAGRAVTKHPQYFGYESTEALRKVYRSDEAINNLASSRLKDVLRNGTKTTGAGGRYPNGWVTYTLPNGNAARWGSDGLFIGFRGVK